ncbi:transcriptional repressor LexA [uncultured Paludibaculum sp.]|uniref:transcriptional repressor LexA n=1 Tax=uncultured Paludibaculum sp. TaxID=1765020 RepID=UPI002AAAB791|nr:transcriptional repressor LexA [uncultured Paludibaculum sp.]
MSLTDRQREIYDYIVAFRRENGCSPSIPEIQRHFDIRSPNGVAGHLAALEAKGAIRMADRVGSRRIEVVAEKQMSSELLHTLPVYGHIPAGLPQEYQVSAAESTAVFDETMLGFKPREGCFLLKVRGESMKDAGILNGDMVVIEPSPSPSAGQIVAALIDGESTLKRLVRVKGRWFLQAENVEYPELHPRADLVIQGVVRTVVRKL